MKSRLASRTRILTGRGRFAGRSASSSLRRRCSRCSLAPPSFTGGGRDGRHAPAPQAESTPASENLRPDVAVTTNEQMRQITVEPVTERALAMERETTGKVAFNEERMTPVFTPYAGRVLEVSATKG